MEGWVVKSPSAVHGHHQALKAGPKDLGIDLFSTDLTEFFRPVVLGRSGIAIVVVTTTSPKWGN